MFFELEFEPDGHRCVLKQIVAQDWKNDMHLHQTEWLGRARGNNTDDRCFVKGCKGWKWVV